MIGSRFVGLGGSRKRRSTLPPIFLFMALLIGASGFAHAEETAPERSGGPMGVGFIVGDLDGMSLKYWPNSINVFQVRLGSVSKLNSFGISGTYEYHFRPIEVKDKIYSLPFYFGLGARYHVAATDYTYMDVGLVGVLGMSVLVPETPAELFFEIRPAFVMYNSKVGISSGMTPGMAMEGGLGVHYYF